MPKGKNQPPEDWHPEIEQWEKIINDPWYNFKKMMEEIKKMEKDKRPLFADKKCPHPNTGWFEHEFICTEYEKY